jgi:hypothetical protein
MDIKELDKKQLILLTLLITFVVSIATGIVTVSLMNQMPKSVPQTINNVIQRTIEKVTTVETPVKTDIATNTNTKDSALLGDGDAVVSIYAFDTKVVTTTENPDPVVSGDTTATNTTPVSSAPTTDKQALGQGIIISDIGLILVDSSILNESLVYKVILNKKDFDATVLKKFGNGFTVLKISEKKNITDSTAKTTDTTKNTQ